VITLFNQRRGDLIGVVLVLLLVGIGLARTHLDTSVDTFVSGDDAAARSLQERDRAFGADPIVVLLHGSGQNGLLLDPTELRQLVQVEGRLAGLDDVAVVYGPATVLNQTAKSLQDTLVQIVGRRDALQNAAELKAKRSGATPAQVAAAGAAAVRDIDRRYGTLLVSALPAGLPTLSNQRFVASVLFDDDGNPRRRWRFLVPDPKSATILIRPRERATQAETARLVRNVTQTVKAAHLEVDRTTVTGTPVVTAAVAEDALGEAPWLALAALFGVGGVLWISRWSVSRRLRLVPVGAAVAGAVSTISLFGLLGLPLTLGSVAVLPVLLGIGSDFPMYLLQARSRRVILVSVAASAAAFAALAVSPSPFVRAFGIALALGLLLTSAYTLWLVRSGLLSVTEAADEASPVDVRAAGTGRTRIVAGVAVVVAAVGWAVFPHIAVETSPQHLAEGLPALNGIATAERTLGYSGELTVLLTGKDTLRPSAVEWAVETERKIVEAHGDQVRPLLSPRQVFGALGANPTAAEVTAASRLIGPYLVSGVVSGDRTASAMTFGVTLDDVRDQQRLVADLRTLVAHPPPGYQASVTGVPVLAARTLSLLDAGRFAVNLLAMLAAAAVVSFRSRRRGAAALLTSLVASGWLFAGAWLAGIALSPLTVAVGALVTVTSCEFATLLWQGRRTDGTWAARTVTVAAVAGTVGYGVLAFSRLAVLRDFGILLALGVVASYVAARVVVPAIGHEQQVAAPAERIPS
jgi:predicted RND superfamily exporter protein